MNILAKAVQDLFFKIPKEIINEAFVEEGHQWRKTPTSLEERIMTKIIRPRVLVDANLVGGSTVILNLDGLNPMYIDNFTIVYQIPPERLNFRDIISVLSVGYMTYNNTYYQMGAGVGSVNPNTMSDVLTAGQRVGDSFSNIPAVSTSNVELVGHNTILIRDMVRMTNMYQLRVVVGNDENLSNISPRSYLAFSKLCELAVKSYIYNKLIIQIDVAYLKGGQELGAFKSIVEGYADSEEMYVTYLNEVWGAVALMNSKTDHTRLIKQQINSAI